MNKKEIIDEEYLRLEIFVKSSKEGNTHRDLITFPHTKTCTLYTMCHNVTNLSPLVM